MQRGKELAVKIVQHDHEPQDDDGHPGPQAGLVFGSVTAETFLTPLRTAETMMIAMTMTVRDENRRNQPWLISKWYPAEAEAFTGVRTPGAVSPLMVMISEPFTTAGAVAMPTGHSPWCVHLFPMTS